MQHAIDHIIFGFLLAIPLIEWKWSWPRFLNKLAGGGANVRWTYYQKLIASEWIPTICLLTYWALQHRAWSALRLAGDTPLPLGLGLGYVLVLIAFLMLQRRALLGRPDRRARILTALRNVEPLIPHTSPERKLFWVVSATAGFCEELFYRGFLMWYLSAWMGPVAAVLLASAIFGIGPVYLGIAQVPKTAIVGLLLGLVVSLTGSLWPAMLLHAAFDWNSGELGFRLLGTSAHSSLESEPPIP